MARAVADGAKQVPGAEVEVRPVSEATPDDLLAADGIIMGGRPCIMGRWRRRLSL